MKAIQISPQQDFLERSWSAKPIDAVAELIWNGIDAGAKSIEVEYKTGPLFNLEKVVVRDDGAGIDSSKIQNLFGDIGNSWKQESAKCYGRILHGKKGEGRFKAFALGDSVSWHTCYKGSGSNKEYKILGVSNPCSFEYSDVTNSDSSTFTEVTISDIKSCVQAALCSEGALAIFGQIFSYYLYKNPDLNISINGEKIVPQNFFSVLAIEKLEDVLSENGKNYPVTLEILKWGHKVEKELCLCDSLGTELLSSRFNFPSKDLYFTVQLKSDYFRDLDNTGRLLLKELDPDIEELIAQAKEKTRGYIRAEIAKANAHIVARWKKDKIYPYEEKKELTPVEDAERQVFEIVGVNIENYLPNFEEADNKQKLFTFKLIAQAITNNPASLQKIITEVLSLSKEAQDDLADLLEFSPLANIIKSAKTIANRLDFLTGLKQLLFDKECKKTLLERDQLHKILEKEAWIFDENFALNVSEASLNKVLHAHLSALGKRRDDESEVPLPDGRKGRVDLMLSLSIKPRTDQTDHLIVELKRPSQKITPEILNQIENYALAVSSEEQFDSKRTHWKFIVVANEMDKYAKMKVNQKDRSSGLYFDGKDNVEVWALTWAEVINNAEARLQYLKEALGYCSNDESAKKYLKEKHAKFIPEEAQ